MTSDNAKDNSGIRGRTHSDLYLACGSLMFIILLIDLSIPLGAAMGVPYIIVILISLWSPHKANTVLLAAICSAFTIGVFFYQPAVAEMWKVVFNRFITVFAIWATAFVGLQWKTAEQNREKAIHDRENTLKDIRILRGLLPICASCKKIRDDQGYWTQIEEYIHSHSEAEFSHGICPECGKKLYPEFYKEKNHDAK